MGCGCGKKKTVVPVDADAPDPNEQTERSEAWWQAHPTGAAKSTVAVPMPQ